MNRSLALWCRGCGDRTSFPVAFEEKAEQASSWDFSREARIVQISGEFWTAPISFKGDLWCLSTAGSLLCLFPRASGPVAFADIGTGYGNAPGVISEVGPRRIPHFFAASRSGVKGVNLVTGQNTDCVHLREGEEVLSNMSESCATIAAGSEGFFFLLRKGGRTFLAAGALDQGLLATYELPEAESYAGPIKVSEWVAVYSQEKLFMLEQEKIKETPFGNSFRAWAAPDHVADLRPPAGHLPYLATADALYIPGYFRDTPTLLRVSSPANLTPLVSEEGVYLCDARGRLLFSAQGEIRVYEGTVPSCLQNDGQLQGRYCAFADNSLAVGFVGLGGGGEALRFYQKNKKQDYPAIRLGRGISAMGFYYLGDSFALAFLADQSLRVAVWNL